MQNLSYHCEILAPNITDPSIWTGSFSWDERRHAHLLRSAQQLRGRCYLADGAVRPEQLVPDGRFTTPDDERSWHFLVVANTNRVIGCVRYSLFDPRITRFNDLRASDLVQFADREWSRKLVAIVEADLALARSRGSLYAELGGWAIAEEYRGTKLALETVLASYAWGALVRNGCICSCTATVRHGSASILRRIGGRPLESTEGTLPLYWDPRYGCEMEMLRFDSQAVVPRYRRLVVEIQSQLKNRAALQAGGAASQEQFRESLLNLSRALEVGRGLVPALTNSHPAEVNLPNR
ncbi:MAG: hypothetical protein JO340_06910 [Acidobacteriaceae bacterium]|nr:hypothetical protein [Acidobacteriaceae bacterium]